MKKEINIMTIEAVEYRVEEGIIFTKDLDGLFRQEYDIPLEHIRTLKFRFSDIDFDDYNCY
ncbi:hypothetical protein [Halobacteriovorax sp. ZH5_bin.2]|uniref:hypothetical protein n=1 Tax=unclassified Halobacteriovorax TaxID=2639665 RepID=UPI00371F5386